MASNGNRSGQGAGDSEGIINSIAPEPNRLASLAQDMGVSRMRHVAGVTANKTTHVSDDNIRNARKTCSHCAKCGCTLTPEAAVWITSLPIKPLFGQRVWYLAAPVCEQCAGPRARSRPARPCEHCQRLVHHQNRFRGWRTFCCETCESAVHVREARARRAKARGTRQCETCGETFEPTRTDARFCSSPCRQRAYRRRKAVTDDETTGIPYFDNHNANAGGWS
jgi:hypothetical protein